MSLKENIDVIQNSKLAAADKAKLVRLMQLLAKSSRDMTGDELRAARVAAGLTMKQALTLIKSPAVEHNELVAIEVMGMNRFVRETEPSADWIDKLVVSLDEIYGLGEAQPTTPAAPAAPKGGE